MNATRSSLATNAVAAKPASRSQSGASSPGAHSLAPHLALARQRPFAGPDAAQGRATAVVRGALPPWLRGTLLRVAPMFGASAAWGPSHWFDALAIAGKIDFGGDGPITLRWSRIESDVARAARSGRVPTAHFGTRNQRGFFQRLVQPIPIVTDNTNVNIVKLGDDFVALTESSRQWVLDGGDLRAVSRPAYDDELGPHAMMLAHPIIANDRVTNLAVKLGRNAEISVYTHAARERSRKVLGTWTTPELPYLHSFGLTDKTAIIVAHPLTLRPASLLWSNGGLTDHFRWHPERGTRLVLVDLATGSTSEFETDAFFTFHVVQAFESDVGGDGGGGTVTVDLLAYDDASIFGRLSTSALLEAAPTLDSRLTRFVIHRKTKRVERQTLGDVCFEFPHMDFKLAHGRSAKTVYGATFVTEGGSTVNEVVAIDLATGAARRFRDDAYALGEPVFVGKPDRTREGDGVLLVLGTAEADSALFVLDATTLEPLATASFDVPFPLGFHGSFARR